MYKNGKLVTDSGSSKKDKPTADQSNKAKESKFQNFSTNDSSMSSENKYELI